MLLANLPSTDKHGICDKLRARPDLTDCSISLALRSAADAFRLIDDKDGATVLVRYQSRSATTDVNSLITLLQREGPARWLMRKLQRFGVTIYRHDIDALLRSGDIVEVGLCPGLYVQREGCDNLYDPVLGLRVDSAPGDPVLVV